MLGRYRAPARLGRMRGEHRVEAHRLQPRERRVVADLCRQAHEGRRDGIGGVLAVGPSVPLAEDAHALVLLGEVHEVEVAGEGPGDLVGALHGERVGDRLRLRVRERCLVGVGVDGRDAEPLDVLEKAR